MLTLEKNEKTELTWRSCFYSVSQYSNHLLGLSPLPGWSCTKSAVLGPVLGVLELAEERTVGDSGGRKWSGYFLRSRSLAGEWL